MTTKEKLAQSIRVIGCIVAAILAWQIVRLFQGQVGIPFLDPLYRDAAITFGESIFRDGLRYIAGAIVWFMLAMAALATFIHLARIIEIGFLPYLDESTQIEEERRRQAQIDAEREHRRSARTKAQEPQAEKSSFSVWSLVVGVIIGSFFF